MADHPAIDGNESAGPIARSSGRYGANERLLRAWPRPISELVHATMRASDARETLFFDYWRQHRLAIKVARIFNTYGPRMHPNDGRVVSNFIVQAFRGQDITIYGDGWQTRFFVMST